MILFLSIAFIFLVLCMILGIKMGKDFEEQDNELKKKL
jgi:hypothetical protein